MPSIDFDDVNPWFEQTKLHVTDLDVALEAQITTGILAQLAPVFEVDAWVTTELTPRLVRKAIAMTYASWLYSRTYSEDEPGSNEYSLRLLASAQIIIDGLVGGSLLLPVDETGGTPVEPKGTVQFYPTDASSAMTATFDDPSLGPASFTMGKIW